jgi:hypothetical protein
MQVKRQFFDNVQIGGGIPLQFLRGNEENKDRLAAALVQVTSDDQTIAAIIAGTDQDEGKTVGSRAQLLLHHQNGAQTGIFHENHARDAIFFYGRPVKFPYFTGGWKFHQYIACNFSRP